MDRDDDSVNAGGGWVGANARNDVDIAKLFSFQPVQKCKCAKFRVSARYPHAGAVGLWTGCSWFRSWPNFASDQTAATSTKNFFRSSKRPRPNPSLWPSKRPNFPRLRRGVPQAGEDRPHRDVTRAGTRPSLASLVRAPLSPPQCRRLARASALAAPLAWPCASASLARTLAAMPAARAADPSPNT